MRLRNDLFVGVMDVYARPVQQVTLRFGFLYLTFRRFGCDAREAAPATGGHLCGLAVLRRPGERRGRQLVLIVPDGNRRIYVACREGWN
jgi:hypothetical protein